MATIYPRVTQERIDLGTPRDACGCPVALAVAAELPPSATVWTFAHRIFVDGRPYLTPPAVWSFVTAFDEGREVREFTFALDVEDAAVERRAVAA